MPHTEEEERCHYRSSENEPLLLRIGQALRRARLRSGMTQAQLGERIGEDAYIIREIECATVDASLTMWIDITKALGVTLNDITA